MRNLGLNHIQIKVSNLDRSLSFYQGLLGMQETARHGSLVFLRSSDGSDVFTLHQTDEPLDSTAGGLQHFGFVIPRDDHARAVEEAREFGCEILGVGQHGQGVLYAYIKDPDGYIVELEG